MKQLCYEQPKHQRGFTPTNEERNECSHSFRQSAVGANDRRGFTLVETLVAITILLVAIVGPMTIAARGLQTAFYAREQITAFSLAQEGVELVREIRDENALTHNGNWLHGLASCGNTNGCGFDARGNAVSSCNSDGSACQLNYDSTAFPPLPSASPRGFYTYAAGTRSPFTRQIFITNTVVGTEALVTVAVTWQSGLFAVPRTVTVQSRLFNQYNNL